jgi:hypothetical protein
MLGRWPVFPAKLLVEAAPRDTTSGSSTWACFSVIDGAQSPAQEYSAGTNPGLSELELPATAIAPAGGRAQARAN